MELSTLWDKRGQGGLLWWIPAIIIMSGVFALIVWLGVSMFTAHSSFYDLHKEMMYERAPQNLRTLNPLTGTYVAAQTYSDQFIQDSLRTQKEISMIVHWQGKMYYYNKTRYLLMRERIPVVNEQRSAKKHIGGELLNITVVQRRQQ
jgi:hypothetical protein